MKKERLVKCYGTVCESEGRKYPKSTMQEVSSRNYCPTCFPIIRQETNDRNNLYGFIREVFGTNGFSSIERLVKTQVKKFHAEGMKYKGMELTLYYMVNIENIKFDSRGIALLPYYYDKAREWYVKNQQLQKQTKDFEVRETVVYVSPKRIENRYRQEKLLSMEDL